jgi:creatinine amidohydrolase
MTGSEAVLWAELFPHELLRRIDECPIVYLPLGLCEPHGHGAVLGLDTLKAEGLCVGAARRFGGVVAPSLGYHIHETGYHARWLEEAVGDVNPRMTAVPPHALLYFFLYQLRAFHNAGFRATIVVTGHAGGNEQDLRLAAAAFMRCSPMRVVALADWELVQGQFAGDHAGRYEYSQLMALRPELVDLERLTRVSGPGSSSALGRFAQGNDAHQASVTHGAQILEASWARLGQIAADLKPPPGAPSVPWPSLGYQEIETVWCELLSQSVRWTSLRFEKNS